MCNFLKIEGKPKIDLMQKIYRKTKVLGEVLHSDGMGWSPVSRGMANVTSDL